MQNHTREDSSSQVENSKKAPCGEYGELMPKVQEPGEGFERDSNTA